ncbi:MAG: nicotinamide mononucleotide transporter [Flavobacteriaceae bacterium]|nr:nicotinamide mononucleotide transporter [Flavobacteriaceae bacterium]|tara:strand:+ start:337 stop:954 length:618 start_codon:yes stop_codon:yes gene_type:complete
MSELYNFFLDSYSSYSHLDIVLEFLAFSFGIISVIYAKKENILVYPTGIICTVITVYILFKAQYLGDMMMNVYYSIMSIYGWWNWSRKDKDKYLIKISRFSKNDLGLTISLFVLTICITYSVYLFSLNEIGIPNYIDVFTSGLFFTAMWLMANKKLESWIFWIIADIITVPLYAYRGLGMLSLQYIIFTILAIQGYLEWKKSLNK